MLLFSPLLRLTARDWRRDISCRLCVKKGMDEQVSLENAKSTFQSLISGLDPADASSFVGWVMDMCSVGAACRDATPEKDNSNTQAEEVLSSIVQDLTQRIPLEGILESEKTLFPQVGPNADMDQATTVHVDAFLYEDEDIDRLCDEGIMSRNYCCDCGSHKTAPLTFISHSSSKLQLKYLFKSALPRFHGSSLTNKLLVDVGSRLGAVLYGAYLFSPISRIVGVEISEDLCKLQHEMVNKYAMSDRIQIKCANICEEEALLHRADVVILNNVFEFFLSMDEQIGTWKILRHLINKPGCLLITVPSLLEATSVGQSHQPVIDIDNWVEEVSLDYHDCKVQCSEDELEEIQRMFVYKVK